MRGGAREDEERGAQRRRVHLRRPKPQADEAAARRGRRDGDVRQASGGGTVQAAGVRRGDRQLPDGMARPGGDGGGHPGDPRTKAETAPRTTPGICRLTLKKVMFFLLILKRQDIAIPKIFRTFVPYSNDTWDGGKRDTCQDGRGAQRRHHRHVGEPPKGSRRPQRAHQGADLPGGMAQPPALRAQVGASGHHRPQPDQPLRRRTGPADEAGRGSEGRSRGEDRQDQGGPRTRKEEPPDDGGPSRAGARGHHPRGCRQGPLQEDRRGGDPRGGAQARPALHQGDRP